MTGGRPSRVSRHTVRHRMALRSPQGVRTPSTNPPAQARSPGRERVRATVSRVLRPGDAGLLVTEEELDWPGACPGQQLHGEGVAPAEKGGAQAPAHRPSPGPAAGGSGGSERLGGVPEPTPDEIVDFYRSGA